MSISLEEKLARSKPTPGTKARATLAQLRKMSGFSEEDGRYIVRVMGDMSWVWIHVSGRGEDAIFERL